MSLDWSLVTGQFSLILSLYAFRDYQKKRDAILNLKRKILEKNPDEFYFNMVKTHMKDGQHKLRKSEKEFTEDELKLMKSQDINYIKMHLQMELKVRAIFVSQAIKRSIYQSIDRSIGFQKIDKLKSAMHLIEFDGLPENKHKYFHEKGDDLVESTSSDAKKTFGRANRLTLDQIKNAQLPTWVDDDFVQDMIKARTKKYKELIKRCSRAESLRKLEEAYDLKQVEWLSISNTRHVGVLSFTHLSPAFTETNESRG